MPITGTRSLMELVEGPTRARVSPKVPFADALIIPHQTFSSRAQGEVVGEVHRTVRDL